MRAGFDKRDFICGPPTRSPGPRSTWWSKKEGRAFGIDIIGYSGELGAAIDLERYRMFARAGLSLFPLPWSAWERDAAVCYEAIERHWRNVAPLPSRK